MTRSTQTLTQSGLLAVLLECQRYKAIQSARRRVQGERVRAAFWNTLTRSRRAFTSPTLGDVARHT